MNKKCSKGHSGNWQHRSSRIDIYSYFKSYWSTKPSHPPNLLIPTICMHSTKPICCSQNKRRDSFVSIVKFKHLIQLKGISTTTCMPLCYLLQYQLLQLLLSSKLYLSSSLPTHSSHWSFTQVMIFNRNAEPWKEMEPLINTAHQVLQIPNKMETLLNFTSTICPFFFICPFLNYM